MATIISWTDETWNPVTGCSRISDGCRNCYAERLSLKFGWTSLPWTAGNAEQNVVCRPERLRKPLSWKDGRRIFTNSMSDMYHRLVPDTFLAQIFAVMNDTPRHTYQNLTKRPERAATWPGPWTPNIWQGTSVEDRKALSRLDHLRRCGAAIKFLSVEPLLEDLGEINLDGIDWVIVGGESGPKFRPMQHGWAVKIKDQCVAAGVAFFFKQSAAFRTEMGTALMEPNGSAYEWRQMPGDLVPPRLLRAA